MHWSRSVIPKVNNTRDVDSGSVGSFRNEAIQFDNVGGIFFSNKENSPSNRQMVFACLVRCIF